MTVEPAQVGPSAPEPDACIEMYRQMVLIRHFEELALTLRHDGQIHGVVHPYSGQEAIAVGVCANLRTSDRIVSNHRGHGHRHVVHHYHVKHRPVVHHYHYRPAPRPVYVVHPVPRPVYVVERPHYNGAALLAGAVIGAAIVHHATMGY